MARSLFRGRDILLFAGCGAIGWFAGDLIGRRIWHVLDRISSLEQRDDRRRAADGEKSEQQHPASVAVVPPAHQQTPSNAKINKSTRQRPNFKDAIMTADQVMRRYKEEKGVPGIAVGVLVDGRAVWKTGYGYSDVENLIPCTGDTVMRIGSISKSITMTLVAKLMQENKLDLGAPIQKYVPSFPEKFVDGEKAVITTRHLVSHLAGIRHYEKPTPGDNKAATATPVDQKRHSATTQSANDNRFSGRDDVSSAGDAASKTLCDKCKAQISQSKKSEFQYIEYYNQKQYDSVIDALSMFKDEPLLSKPGTQFKYTTHGWTLVSAVIEGAEGGGKKFQDQLKDLFALFGMRGTYLDENYPLIPNRCQYYRRRPSSHRYLLENVPSVNNSYKWAGGGLVSNVGDLLRFAKALLFFYNHCPAGGNSATPSSCYLNRRTLEQIWRPVENCRVPWASKNGTYAMGWAVTPDVRLLKMDDGGQETKQEKQFYVCHTGGSIGASCVLLMKPDTRIAVVVLTNLQECSGLYDLARTVADNFEENIAPAS